MLLRHGHGRTFVAVPCYGQIPAVAMFGLLKLDCEIACLVGTCHVDDARNMLVSVFLQDTDCDQLLFIDADTSVEDLSRFIEIDEPVVGAAIPKKGDGAEFACNLLPGAIWADERGLIEVQAVGTGVLKIQRPVLQAIFDASRQYRQDKRLVAEIFNRDVVNGERLSGDLNFCRKWREQGGRVFVEPELRVQHTGEKTWSGTFGSHLRRINGIGLTRGIHKIQSGQYEREDVVGLIDEWGNESFSAGHEFLAACIEVAQQAQGPILECGSGVSSLAMAATGAEVHALEHDPAWISKVVEARDRLGLETLHVHYAPLKDGWYSGVEWPDCDIVVCDGPPRYCSDRNKLYEHMKATPRLILHDDISDPEELSFVETHEFQVMGQLKSFAVGRWRDPTYRLSAMRSA